MRWFIWWSRIGAATNSEGPFDSQEAAEYRAAIGVITRPDYTYEIKLEAR